MNHDVPDNSYDSAAQPTADSLQAVVRFLWVLRRRLHYVFATLVIACAFGALYYFTEPKLYEAKASLLVTQNGPDKWNAPAMRQTGPDALVPTYERLFSQSVVLEGALAKIQSLPPKLLIDFAAQPRDKWVDVLRLRLAASSIRRTNIIELSYRSMNPKAAEAVVSAVVQSYLKFMDKHHKDVSVEVATMLKSERFLVDKQLAEKQTEYLKAKNKAKSFSVGEDQKTIHPLVQHAFTLYESAVDVQKERVNLEATMTAIQSSMRNGGDLRLHLISIDPVAGKDLMANALGVSPQITESLNQIDRKLIGDRARLEMWTNHLGARHPDVIELRGNIRNAEEYVANNQAVISQRLAGFGNGRFGPKLLSMVEEKLTKARAHEQELFAQYTAAEKKALALDDQLAALQLHGNELEFLRELRKTLLGRIAAIETNDTSADVRVDIVTDPVVSENPVAPRLSLVALACLLMGIGGGVGVVYVMDLLDDRFRSPEELTDQLGLPVLTMVRDLTVRAQSGIDAIQVHVAPEEVDSESFRTLRTTLAFSGQETDRLAITSTEPSDGKTTVLANLAASFAQAGKRTLLIDADMRKPGLSKLFAMRRVTGLANVLRSSENIESECRQHIQPTGIHGLDILPIGPKPPDPTELLSRSRFADFIAWASTEYDQLLIDCPPVLAASDAMIIGRLADGMLLVVQPEKNHRRLVMRAVEQMQSMSLSILGIVANRISENRDGYYGYGYGYGYGYSSGYGYGHNEDDADAEGQIVSIDSAPSRRTNRQRRAA